MPVVNIKPFANSCQPGHQVLPINEFVESYVWKDTKKSCKMDLEKAYDLRESMEK